MTKSTDLQAVLLSAAAQRTAGQLLPAAQSVTATADRVAQAVPSSPRGPTKAALLLSLLQREQGATLAELVAATGWLPHTVRAALTGVCKKGHAVTKGKRAE